MRFIGLNLEQPGLEAYLHDNYLHTITPVQLNDTTHINIEINNNAGSYAIDRFMLVYSTKSFVVPPHFTAFNGISKEGQIFLNWVTENQSKTNEYFVQKSSDGLHFVDVASINANDFSTRNYEWTDHYPVNEYNYYRVRSSDTSGSNNFSDVVTVKTLLLARKEIRVFPNPVIASNLNLDVTDQPEGKYQVQLYTASGILLTNETFNKYAGMGSIKLSVHQNLLPGIYHLQILKPSGERQLINVIVE